MDRYLSETGHKMDEIKLQKLLYFTQREAIIRSGVPMFDAEFHAWKYGPVIVDIQRLYKADMLHDELPQESVERWSECLDYVLNEYAPKRTMSLVTLSHGELSWKKARKGYGKYERSDVPMQLDDIYKDAERIKERRRTLPLRQKVRSFLDQHPEIQFVPMIPKH